jgi:hypothetical protein
VQGLEVDGVYYEEEFEKRDRVVHFYQTLYQETESWRPSVDDLEFDSLDGEDAHLLEQPFDKEEILQALREIKGDKAPGPNGFSMAFYQKC